MRGGGVNVGCREYEVAGGEGGAGKRGCDGWIGGGLACNGCEGCIPLKRKWE